MNENISVVDLDKLHELFMAGEKIVVIAHKFGVSEGYIQQLVSKQRKINPDKWQKRYKQKSPLYLQAGIADKEPTDTDDDKAKERLLSLINSELFVVKKLFEEKYTVEYDIPNKTARIKNVDLSDLDLIFATALKEIEALETKHEKFVNDAYDGIKKQEEENRQLQRTIDDLKKELEESESRYLDTLNELLDAHKEG